MHGAVDDRDRTAPKPLARDQPVPQSVVDLSLADALGHQPLSRLGLGGGNVQPVEPLAVDLLARAGVGTPAAAGLVPTLGWLHGAHHGKTVGLREIPVPGVLRRDSHDGTRAVAHQYVVGHIDRDRSIGEGIDHRRTGECASFGQTQGAALRHALDLGAGRSSSAQIADLNEVLGGGQRIDQGVLRCDHRIGHPE